MQYLVCKDKAEYEKYLFLSSTSRLDVLQLTHKDQLKDLGKHKLLFYGGYRSHPLYPQAAKLAGRE